MVMKDMRNVHVFFICFMMFILIPMASFAKVTAKVDRNSIVIDETLSLTLTRDGTSFFSNPDLQQLEKDFKVLGQSQSSKTSIINGKTTSSVEWNIALAPRRTGTFEIPPITIGKEKSNALRVKVTKATQPKTRADNAQIFTETDVDTDSVYVQSQVILTLRLYWAVDIRIAEPMDPQLDDALVTKLNDTTYDKMVNGQSYTVFERKYSIFPQKSGSLEIPSIIIEGTIPSRQRSQGFFDPFGTRGQKIRLRSDPKTILVKEQPPEFPTDKVWLPADMLLIKDQWNNNTQDLTVGESTTVTISLTAAGLMGEQLPPITLPETEGLKLYQGKAEIENGTSEGGIIGIRKESIALIPTRAGTFELPELRIPWWDKHLGKVEYAVLPARTLSIKGTQVDANTATSNVPPAKAAQQKTEDSPAPQTASSKASPVWIFLCILFAAGWLITLYLLINTRRKVTLLSEGERQKQLEEISLREKDAFAALSSACRANDPAAARKSITTWLQAFHPETRIQTFSDLNKDIHAPELLAQLHALDSTLFDPTAELLQWKGSDLLAEVKKLRSNREKTQQKKGVLEQLYK